MITSYEQMPVGIYERLMAIATDKDLDTNAANLATVAVLTGRTEGELLDEPLDEWRRQVDAAAFLLVYPRAAKVRDTYELGGVRYRATLQDRRMTAGQYIDFQEYLKSGGDRWAEVMSVLLVPEGRTYGSGYDVADVQAAVREHLCILDAIALRAFFLTSSAASATASLPSLDKALRKMGTTRTARRTELRRIRKEAELLRRSGAGFQTLTRWLNLPDATGTR